MDREDIEEAIEVLEDASAEMLGETGDENYYAGAIAILRQALVDADDTLQKRADEMVKTEHDRAVELVKAYERGWNAALAQQEPVAWRTFDGEGGYDYRSYEMNETYDKEWAERNPNHKGWVEPLYTAPPISDYHEGWEEGFKAAKRANWFHITDEQLIEKVRRRGFVIRDSQIDVPKREWVGLTAYEIQEIYLKDLHWGNFACAIEAKLKEKNGG